MWVGEQMSERGIGNGISLLIFAGIAARIPGGIGSGMSLYRSGEMSFFKILDRSRDHRRDFLRDHFCGARCSQNSNSICEANCRS